jgi:type III restriction enzyme
MKLKNYQKSAVDRLLTVSKNLLEKEGSRICVFKAPTGSGKTIMMADFLDQLAREHLLNKYAFIWISGNNLHQQSREKLENYLDTSRYTFSYLEEIDKHELDKNEIVFVNWHSLTKQDKKTGEWTNIFMRNNENDRNLITFVNNTKNAGKKIILIVDESHYHYWSDKSQDLVLNTIDPKLVIEVSATPKLEPKAEDIANCDAGFIAVKFDEVVKEGMIKTEVIVNKEIGKHHSFEASADEVILSSAIKKREEIQNLHKTEKTRINPLVLIQLPSESSTTSALDQSKLKFIEKYLGDTHNITTKNGKLAIWLSERKENTEMVTNSDNDVEIMIFKQAIALGWDCPRAQILIMFRDIKSITFEIQTVGRILRTPEAKHYQNEELNKAFVYTNLDKVSIADDESSQKFFQVHPVHRKSPYKPIKLPSIYLSRIDYGDLTLEFRKIFINEANSRFGITSKDLPGTAYKKADKELDLYPKELTKPIISETIISNIDGAKDIIGSTIEFNIPEDDLKYKFELFAKINSLPYAPIRSHTKIQQAFYDWFDYYLGYKNKSRIEIQRAIVCSESNQQLFKEIIETAKEQFHSIKKEQKKAKQDKEKKEYIWEVPMIDYYNELYDNEECSNYIMDKCYLLKDRSTPEIKFEIFLNKNKNIDWWYKNGVSKETYFAIDYFDQKEDIQRAFYPDYIVKTKKGMIGIFDTKSGYTADSNETKTKSDSLQKHIKKHKDLNLFGGIIIQNKTGIYVFNGTNYSDGDVKQKGWESLII